MRALRYLRIFLLLYSFTIYIVEAAVPKKIKSDEAAQIIKKLSDWYKDEEAYSMDIEIRTYKEFSSDLVHDSKKGYVKKKGRNFHSYMMGTHSIQNSKYKITLDSARNFMSIKDAEQNMWENISLEILGRYLNASSNITVSDVNGNYVLKIVPPINSALKQYELIYDNKNRISKITMEMEKEELAEYGKTRFMIYPKIVFEFKNYSKIPKIGADEFITESYVTLGAEIVPNKEYAKFDFFDLRVNDKLNK